MTQPWCEQQRQALRVFRKAVALRAERENALTMEHERRLTASQEQYANEKERVESEYGGARSGTLNQRETTRRQIEQRHTKESRDLEGEFQTIKDKITHEYDNAKAKLEAEFREARWTTNTAYEADKRVAKEEYVEAQTSCKTLLRKQLADWRAGRNLIDAWTFLDDIPPLDPKDIPAQFKDPWERLRQCAEQAAADRHALEQTRGTEFINGRLPWLIFIALWLVLTLPLSFIAFVVSNEAIVAAIFVASGLWLVSAAAVLPFGFWAIKRLRQRKNDSIIAVWLSLRHSVHLARTLRGHCMKLAKKTYLVKKRQSFRDNRDQLKSIVEQTRVQLEALRRQRDASLKKNDQIFKNRQLQQKEQQEKEKRTSEEQVTRQEKQAESRYAQEKQAVETQHQRRQEEDRQWHAQEWTVLLRDWKTACDQFTLACRSIAKLAAEWFPELSSPFELPASLPQGLPLGRMEWSLQNFPDGEPADPQLPRPDLEKLIFPALVPFPQQASVLFRAQGDGKAAGIAALHAILLRAWTSMPAGKVRCTIIDAVGRGENFSAFMHLADHDEKLVDGRIWTEIIQIDERFTLLTQHMENVLQKYLRNQYETLADYNAQAGEVAEPFHFLVAAHFPVNFSEDATRRLISLAAAGARCGIYTLVLVDTKQPMPHGFQLADLEKVCTCLDWRKDHFVWEDDDFGMFPLEMEKLPEPARCTEIMQQVGDQAVRASKVEVPFEWIMPAPEAWWTASSADGIRVPIGRFGAQGKQYLELGQGTSQHVLVAGKTGSGKSTLLHVLISQLATFYNPREVELYLVDFKKGVEFKSYASMRLPHARVVAVESEREFGLSVLQRLDGELSRRGELYRAAGVNDMATYRTYSAKHPEVPNLPRVMLIVDEFQEFFIEDDKLAQESSLLLDRLVRQGRAFGLHVLLGSQTIGGAYSLARSTIDQMAVRIALQCSEADAHLILSRDNTEARLLSRPGEGIYNASHGMLEGNHLFQVVWLNDSQRDVILTDLRVRSRQFADLPAPIVFEGSIAADLAQNTLLRDLWQNPRKPTNQWHAWLGDAVAIKDPTCAVFRKQSGSNVMMLGQQEEVAVALTIASLISLAAGVDPALAQPSIHLVVGQALDEAGEALLTQLLDILPVRLWPQRELGTLLNQLADEIERRGQVNAPPQFLCLHGLHRLRDLRKPDDDFGYVKKGEEKNPYRQFTHILKEGPPAGIFTLLWCDTLISLQRCFDRQTLREFDQRVLMQMSAADSSSLMDSPIAAKLGPQRALFYTEDQGKIEKFRPYALPPLEWIQSLPVRKPDLTSVSEPAM
jgi:flagellar biosynthesis GTPase FlhF/energy-coupling factor transporter ATP-binding protein EcfA2